MWGGAANGGRGVAAGEAGAPWVVPSVGLLRRGYCDVDGVRAIRVLAIGLGRLAQR
jgi:hypothetical protein